MLVLTLPRGYAYPEFAGCRLVCNDTPDRVLALHLLITYRNRLALKV